MATAAQKAKAKKDRTAALAAAKAITKKGSKAHLRAIAKVKRLTSVMKEPTQSATDHGSAKDKRDAASEQRSAAITKMKAASGADKEKYRLQALAATSVQLRQPDATSEDLRSRTNGSKLTRRSRTLVLPGRMQRKPQCTTRCLAQALALIQVVAAAVPVAAANPAVVGNPVVEEANQGVAVIVNLLSDWKIGGPTSNTITPTTSMGCRAAVS